MGLKVSYGATDVAPAYSLAQVKDQVSLYQALGIISFRRNILQLCRKASTCIYAKRYRYELAYRALVSRSMP